jgi:hypothetical protein
MYNDISKTEDDYISFLPPIAVARQQATIGQLLGGIQYTTLGDYGAKYFADKKASEAMKKFQIALEKVTVTINERNDQREQLWKDSKGVIAKNWRYETILPKKIPQSINI